MERGETKTLATQLWRWNRNGWHFSIKTGQMYSRWDGVTVSAGNRSWSPVCACISLFTTSVVPARQTVLAFSTNVQNMTQPPSFLRHVLLCSSVCYSAAMWPVAYRLQGHTTFSWPLPLKYYACSSQAITFPCIYAQIYIHKYTKNTELHKPYTTQSRIIIIS